MFLNYQEVILVTIFLLEIRVGKTYENINNGF